LNRHGQNNIFMVYLLSMLLTAHFAVRVYGSRGGKKKNAKD